MAGRQGGKLDAPDGKKGVRANEQRVGPLARESCEGRIDFAAGPT